MSGSLSLTASSAAYAQLELSDLYLDPPAATSPNISQYRRAKFTWNITDPNIHVSGLTRDGGTPPLPGDIQTHSNPNNSQPYAIDTSWQSGVPHEYYLVGTRTYTLYNPITEQYESRTDPWQSNHLRFIGVAQVVTDNGTVDGRLDKRYSAPTPKDYTFNKPAASGPFLYRGGLYVGYNGDGAESARTYLKFTFVSPPLMPGSSTDRQKLYSNKGGLFVFATRLARTGVASIVCRRAAANTSWSQADLVWTNAPAPFGNPSAATTLNWDAQSPAAFWHKVPATSVLEEYITSVGTGTFSPTLTLILQGQSEASTGWAYFARKEYAYSPSTQTTAQTGYGAVLLYAYGDSATGSSGSGGEEEEWGK